MADGAMADQKEAEKLKRLSQWERELLADVMAHHPGLTVDEALAMLKAAGM